MQRKKEITLTKHIKKDLYKPLNISTSSPVAEFRDDFSGYVLIFCRNTKYLRQVLGVYKLLPCVFITTGFNIYPHVYKEMQKGALPGNGLWIIHAIIKTFKLRFGVQYSFTDWISQDFERLALEGRLEIPAKYLK